MNPEINKIDKKIVLWMKKYGLTILRYTVAVVFIWFGALKIFGYSPAQVLVTKTVYWFNSDWFVPFLGWWEVIIGAFFLFRPLLREAIFLLALQMVGTFLPLILLPNVVYGPIPIVTLTLEGQYIIKNLVIIGAAMVIGSHVRDKR